jgi:uncharacterized protein YdgA (DUF945 family)/cytochrome c551/c552
LLFVGEYSLIEIRFRQLLHSNMKRYILFSLATLVLISLIGYPSAAWYIGNQVEATLDEQYKNLNGLIPFIKLSDRKYERGLFTSHETTTATLILPPLQPIQFTLHSKVVHGPFPGMSLIAAATIDTEAGVNDGYKQDAAEWIGDKNLMSIHTIFRMDGNGGESTLNIPVISTPRISWDGMSMKIGYSKNLASYSVHGDIPRFVVSDTGGTLLQITGVKLDSEQKRIFDDEPLLFEGANKLTIAELDLGSGTQGLGAVLPTSLVIKQLVVDQMATSNNGEFIDYDSKIGAEVINVGTQDYGPAHLDSSLQHLHTRTVANLYRAYLENVKKSASHTVNVAEIASTFSSLSQELIKHNAEFRLNRVSFTRPQGEAMLSATIKFRDTTSSDFANKEALLAKLYTSIDVKIPEDLLPPLLQSRFAGIEQAQERVKAGVASLVTQGYITQESGIIKTRLEIHDGQQWLNGKQYVQPVATMFNPAPASPLLADNGMPDSAKKHNCIACHTIDKRLVGPAWRDVSRRYQNASTFEYQGRQYPLEEGLLLKVSKGGSGHWGQMPMPPNDPMGNAQTEIRALVKYILGLAKTDDPQYRQNVTQYKPAEVVPPFRLGQSFDTFMAEARSHGIAGAAIDPHVKTAGGEGTSVWFSSSGIRLFFANDGQHNLKTIRYAPPYAGKHRGIGIGDDLSKLTNTLGSPVRPPWTYSDSQAYLFNGEGNSYVRFDLNQGVVRTIFVLAK